MKLYLWATHTAEYMSFLRLQLEASGLEYEIPPKGAVKWEDGNGWAARLRDYHAWSCKQKGLIGFIDPWDHLFFGTKEELEAKYASFDSPLVWSLERVCWPPPAGKDERDPSLALDYPPTNTIYKFPCGGGMIGEAEVFQQIFDPERIPGFGEPNYDVSKTHHPRGNQIWMDQIYFQDIYKRGIGVGDSTCRIFQSLVHWDREGDEFKREGNRVLNAHTGEYPLFIHANGKCPFPPEFMEALNV